MTKRISKLNLLTTLVAGVLFVLTIPVAVDALNGRANAVAAQDAQTAAQTSQGSPATTAGQANQEAVKTRLSEANVKLCQNRERVITSTMARISDRGQKQLELFTGIAGQAEKYYTDKGKTLSDYATLLAAVQAKQAAAQLAVNAVKTPVSSFSCGGDDPKGVADSFKSMLKIEIDALNAYKTSIKDLIVGVKSVETQTATTQTSGGNQ